MPKIVHMVIGLPKSGKTYAREHDGELSILPTLDLFDVQQAMGRKHLSREDILESYQKALDELLELLEQYDEVVFEHTFVRTIRRPMYLDEVRRRYPDCRIVCHYVHPPLDEYRRRKNGENHDEIVGAFREIAGKTGRKFIDVSSIYDKLNHEMFDIPTIEEGFDEVIAIN